MVSPSRTEATWPVKSAAEPLGGRHRSEQSPTAKQAQDDVEADMTNERLERICALVRNLGVRASSDRPPNPVQGARQNAE